MFFCMYSRHKVSSQKSHIFSSLNVEKWVRRDICRVSGFYEMDDLGHYLGVLVLHSRVKRNTYRYIVENVKKRFLGWNAPQLSLASKITLTQSVLCLISYYVMQTTRLPIHICNQLEKIYRSFIWGSMDGRGRVSLIRWDKVQEPKDYGGLGMRNSSVVNKAFMIKVDQGILSQSSTFIKVG